MKHFTPLRVLLITLGLFLVNCIAIPQSEVDALTAFREAIFDDQHSVLSSWKNPYSDPCEWFGVKCYGDHVIKLNISWSSIEGYLAAGLFELFYLQELDLHGNNLIGSIPKEIGSLKYLKVLDLGRNKLSGPIPHEIGNLASVVKINLQSNSLTGRLPSELGNLKFLEELHLDRNRLSGSVPGANASEFTSSMHGMYTSSPNLLGFCRATPLKVADFSYNFLIGNIPKCLEYLPKSSFQGNCLQNKDAKQRSSQQCSTAPAAKNYTAQGSVEDKQHKQKARKPAWLWALEIVTGITVCSLCLIALVTVVHRCKTKSSIIVSWRKSSSERVHLAIYVDPEALKDVRQFSRQELEVACEDFSNIIGSSSDSLVYKGIIKGGPEIAVISLCIKEEHWTGYLEAYYQKEVKDLSRLNHENAGKLLGYCRESSPFTRMLVFEYASNGTLYEHLHSADEEGCQLSWTRRMNIIIGIARGLKYLHTEIEPPFTISELNSSAVYLTEDFSPKLVDFESWKTILSRSENNSRSMSNEGAICILSNNLEGRHLDIQGNIYAFGVLLLEIISGRPSYCKDKGCLVDWAREYLEQPEAMSSVVDPELKHFREGDLKVICEVVGLCIHLKPRDQITMQDLSSILESKIDTSVASEIKASSMAWAEAALLLQPE